MLHLICSDIEPVISFLKEASQFVCVWGWDLVLEKSDNMFELSKNVEINSISTHNI